jgi:hypothetical protein
MAEKPPEQSAQDLHCCCLIDAHVAAPELTLTSGLTLVCGHAFAHGRV